MTKTVALVGMAETTRNLAPWDNPEVEIWTLNESPAKRFGYVKRVTRHFQLHPKWNYDRDTNQNDPEHPDWLRAQRDFPIYMQEVDPDIPMSVKYPWEEICAHFQLDPGNDHWKEFTSTFPYMLALALYEGFDRIEVYGFEMGSETEYAYQRASAHLWLGVARGLYLSTGKPEIVIPDGSKLIGWGLERYGFDMVLNINPMEVEIDRNKFTNVENELKGKISELEGRQQVAQEQVKAISQEYDKEIAELKAKRTDPKLRERRIREKMLEHQEKTQPLLAEIRRLDAEKLDTNQRLNYVKGMKDYAIMLIGRHNAQIPRLTGPDKGVQIRV